MYRLLPMSLRAFVALAETGTLGGAGDAIGRTASAVSLQITLLERELGRKLFDRSARGMLLSEAGRILLQHAKVLMEAEAQAIAALQEAPLRGELRFGMPQDFASSRLASTLDRFTRDHPGVRVHAFIERNRVIASLARKGDLDLALLIARRSASRALLSQQRRSHWYAGGSFRWKRHRPLPLVLLDEPCVYRDDAIAALERAGVAWEVSFSTANVSAMWAAVTAGVGVTARMDLGAPRNAVPVDETLGLPVLPGTVLSLVSPRSVESSCTDALAALVGRALGRAKGDAVKG
jgi:DNA-binding transcriptional LysR family regulator